MWWQIGLAFWIAFQLGFFAACIVAASHRPVLAWAEAGEYVRAREATFSDRF
jgi:hypothetical protein